MNSPSDAAASPPSHPLARYGWDTAVADAFAPYEEEGLLPARVVRVDRGRCEAVTAGGPVHASTAPVASRDPVRALCTGDWVAVHPRGPGGPPEVRALLPRRTAFVRSASTVRSEGQVLAANIDHAVVAVSLAAEFDLGRVERYVSLAWTSGAQPVLALTKADLLPGPAVLAQLAADAEESAPGVPVLPLSAATGTGLGALRAVIAGGTSVLLGQSGAGKSTLANALLGADVQDVRATRDSDGKGRHTTTGRHLLPLPAESGGGVLIDTPGLRGVGLWDAEDGLGRAFSDIADLAARCRFPDCAHDAEPGCAVRAAVEDGTLAPRRLDSYRKLRRENARHAARTDARSRQGERRRGGRS